MSKSPPQNNQLTDGICPTCGEGFDGKRGVKIHHSKAHGKYIGGVTFNCEECGEVDAVPESQYRTAEHHFCSRECRGKWVMRERGPENRRLPEEYQSGERLRELYHEKRYSTVEIGNMAGVSKTTIIRWMEKHGIERRSVEAGETHHQYDTVHTECHTCGVDVSKNRDRYERDEYHFCSNDCRAVWQSETWRGEGNPAWAGGFAEYYGPNYPEQRLKARERDGGCVQCGMTNSEHILEYGEEVHCHHIKKIRWFKNNLPAPDWYALGNDLSNLVTLCKEHHFRWEGIPVRPSVI